MIYTYFCIILDKSLKVEIEDEDEMDDEVDSARSIRMEMVEVIKLKMSLDMPESKLSL